LQAVDQGGLFGGAVMEEKALFDSIGKKGYLGNRHFQPD
jgi:hypothetical protein